MLGRSESSAEIPVNRDIGLTEILLTPQPIQFSFPFPFAPDSDPPESHSLSTPCNGLTRSVAI